MAAIYAFKPQRQRPVTGDMGRRVITTASGVRIGSAYTPRAPTMDRDALRLQSALLDERTARRAPGLTILWRTR